jgi:hypothetical protein
LRLYLLAFDPGALFLSQLGTRRRAVGAFHALAFVMSALNSLVTETALQASRYFFVLAVIVAVAHGAHRVEVDTRPHDMDMLAS